MLNEEKEVFELAREAYDSAQKYGNQVDSDVRIEYLKAKSRWDAISEEYMRNS